MAARSCRDRDLRRRDEARQLAAADPQGIERSTALVAQRQGEHTGDAIDAPDPAADRRRVDVAAERPRRPRTLDDAQALGEVALDRADDLLSAARGGNHHLGLDAKVAIDR